MSPSRRATVAGIVALCASLSCSVFGPDAGEAWQLAFVNQKSSYYGGPGCPGQINNLYCKTWVDDPEEFSGSLRRKGDRWSLDIGSRGKYQAISSTAQDSVRVALGISETSCVHYYLTFRTLGDSIAGTFSYSSDCHGLGSYGTFTGHR